MAVSEKALRGFTRPINPYSTGILALYTLVWGIWMSTPYWQAVGGDEIFGLLLGLAPDWFWGFTAMLAASSVFLALYLERYRLLTYALGLLTWHWLICAAMLMAAEWQDTGGITYVFIAVLSAYFYLNVRMNYVKYGEGVPRAVA